jgi:hypothetical protein
LEVWTRIARVVRTSAAAFLKIALACLNTVVAEIPCGLLGSASAPAAARGPRTQPFARAARTCAGNSVLIEAIAGGAQVRLRLHQGVPEAVLLGHREEPHSLVIVHPEALQALQRIHGDDVVSAW